MNLPEFDRVIYECNPLFEVVCQLTFPPILKISHQEPVEFQDEVRFEYPLFEQTQPQVPPEIAKVVQQLNLPLPNDSAYVFRSEDQKWNLAIAKNFIALTTSAYGRYEYFKQKLDVAITTFERIYRPSFYTRVGLRYQNLIIRSELDLENKKWSDLITKQIASELHDFELSGSIQSINKNLVLQVENGQVNFNHGLVYVKNPKANEEEEAYLLDADFYTERKIARDENAWNILDSFNQSARNLFRYSISETLHDALRPTTVDPS
jgi:uncharacterized protein (TIGR04255 family)